MNVKKFGLWGFFCVINLVVNSQINISQNKQVIWEEPVTMTQSNEKITLLQFSDMGDINPETEIPNISKSIKLPTLGKPSELSLNIENVEFIWPTPQEHKLFVKKVKNKELEFDYTIARSGQQYFIDLAISPVVKPDQSQTFKKLSSYTINISYKNETKENLKSVAALNNYVPNSVLSSGDWIKVSVEKSGIHKILYSTLNNWGISNPENVAIYGNGGKMIPSSNDDFRHDDLVENSVWHHNQAVYFYAEGPVVWSYNPSVGLFTHEKNNFSNHSYYFITEQSNGSKSIENSTLQSDTYNKEVNYFTDYAYHEEDNINLIKSGNVWFGEKFDYYTNKKYDFNFDFPNAVYGAKAKVYVKFAARSGTPTEFVLLANDTPVDTALVYNINISDDIKDFARVGVINNSFSNITDDINLGLKFDLSGTQTSSLGYLDFICLNVNRDLSFVKDELIFRNIDFLGSEEKLRFSIFNGQGLLIWDITNPLNPLNINTEISGSTSSFNYNINELREFVAFDPNGSFPTPVFVENTVNQNLHGVSFADYVIVCHPDFAEQGERLGKIHNDYNGMSYLVVTTEQIYNEFSSGKPDVTAIRSFVRMLYDRAGDNNQEKPKNLLLFGDGSYDNRPDIPNNTNMIPTYQSDNSTHQTDSYVSDDYMGLLDSDEGSRITSDKVDIGIGRFPVNTINEAKNAVDKTYKYYYEQSNDTWKSQLTFVGDDGDGNIHMRDANSLTIKLESKHPEFNIKKLYFDSFEKITTTSGKSIPEIEVGISESINNGTLLFNYTGHGATYTLADEHIIEKVDIENWNNIEKLPVFVTATCEFSRFDEKEHTSAGEMVFLNPLGGGIALYSTTRIVYSSLNKRLNTSFYNYVFERDSLGQPHTLGQIMRLTKNDLSASVNKLNFSLLGDPAIRIIYPKLGTNTLLLNSSTVYDKMKPDPSSPMQIDSLKALSTISLTGEIINLADTSRANFNGEIFVSVYDKQSQLITRGNDGATPFSYGSFDNVIFKGAATVKAGQFKTDFIIPKDIKFNFDNGKISYYAYANDDKTAFGAFSDVIVGGIDENAAEDNIGPEINIWLNNKNFKSGNSVNSQPILIAEISDESGINTTGNGIGHDITCIIDGNSTKPIILNSDFNAAIDNFKTGEVVRQLPSLEEGKHTLTVKAWDTHNNSSTSSIQFSVSKNGSIAISKSKIYPNPIVNGQSSFIAFLHDDPNARMEIQVMLYDMAGQLVSQKNTSIVSLMNTIPPIELETNRTLSPGLYLYKLIIKSQTGRKGEVSGKIMVIR